MSKKLETVQGININNQYHGNEAHAFDKMLLDTFLSKEPINYKYYELINNDGDVVYILTTENEYIAQSAAHRMGLDYRKVEFEVTYEDLDKKEENK